MPQVLDVVVIGGGQAGLSLGYFLRRQGTRFLILEAAKEVGESWRQRWDSLTLFTPTEYDRLPGLPMSNQAGTYPGKDAVADYLQRYAELFDLPIRLDSRVVGLRRQSEFYRIEIETGEIAARQVVVATGPFQRPFVPSFSVRLASDVAQIHSSSYRRPDILPPGEVLVVGGGNSGWQIAEELSATRSVVLSGRQLPRVPRRLLGRSLFWWLEATGLMRVPSQSALGRRMRSRDGIVIGPAPQWALRSGRLRLAPRVTGAAGHLVEFEDGSSITVGAVVWATGYRTDYSWIDIPVFAESGQPVHRRGVTSEPGLYFLGLRWQHTTGSALLGWVGRDAEYIARQVARVRKSQVSLTEEV